jgi:hypothetical protein
MPKVKKLKAETVLQRLAENPRAPVYSRLRALKELGERPSFYGLLRLIRNPSTPPRLLALASLIYAKRMAVGKSRKTVGPPKGGIDLLGLT